MVKRLLNALDYPSVNTVSVNDETTIRNIIVWVEQNKLNEAKELSGLKNVQSPDWPTCYANYKAKLGCPTLSNALEELHWILGNAVQKETTRNRELYLKHAVENIKITSAPSIVTENPLDKLDFRSKEFVDGINLIAKLLKITAHPDPLITLRAVRKIVAKKLSSTEKPIIITGTPFPIQETDLGFDLKDPVLNQAAKVLRLLYIQDLRGLQTKLNELIVAVQSVTANPKTDTKLGQVGR